MLDVRLSRCAAASKKCIASPKTDESGWWLVGMDKILAFRR
jgi:hypothetical protein